MWKELIKDIAQVLAGVFLAFVIIIGLLMLAGHLASLGYKILPLLLILPLIPLLGIRTFFPPNKRRDD